jgi:hypothetical protein
MVTLERAIEAAKLDKANVVYMVGLIDESEGATAGEDRSNVRDFKLRKSLGCSLNAVLPEP